MTAFYLRDASFSPSSKAGGAMPKYHAQGERGWAACSSGGRSILLIVESAVEAADLRPDEVCKRAACRKAYEDACPPAQQGRQGASRAMSGKERVRIEVDKVTAAEMLACVLVRANWYETRGKPVPQDTLEAVEALVAVLTPGSAPCPTSAAAEVARRTDRRSRR